MKSNLLSLKESSEVSGVSKDTIWRSIRSGDLAAEKIEGKRGFSYRISSEALDHWAQKRGGCQPFNGALPEAEQKDEELQAVGQESFLQAHLEAIKAVQEALQVASTAQLTATSLRMELAAEQEARARAERQMLAIAAELNTHRRVLAEQAESLAEERAKRTAVEAQLEKDAQVEASRELAGLKLDTPTPGRGQGWGHRMRRWLGMKTG